MSPSSAPARIRISPAGSSLELDQAEAAAKPLLQPSSVRRPGVLVVITNYNYAGFVTTAIESVARQSYGDFSCVVVDDCSTDASAAVISELLAELRDERFQLHLSPVNGGQFAAMSAGLAATTQPFVGGIL